MPSTLEESQLWKRFYQSSSPVIFHLLQPINTLEGNIPMSINQPANFNMESFTLAQEDI